MASSPILLMGGIGAIGQLSARALHAAHPDAALLIGGAGDVVIDPDAPDLGLGKRQVGAVAVLYSDDRLAGLHFASQRSVPHLGISSGIFEIAPEVAIYMNRPGAAPIVLGYEWLVGATTVATLACAAAFARLDAIAIGALVDEEDQGGPAVAEDFERLSALMPAALTRRDGAYVWRCDDENKASFRAIDGTVMAASGSSSIDVAGLAVASGARDVSFDIATGVSSSPWRG